MSKIISFDIWDTIIKRKCHPEEIKLHTSYYILLKYSEILKEKYKNIYEILNKRNEIETNICQENKKNGYDDECRIEDVFKKLQKDIFKTNDIDISNELLKEEIEQEKRCIFLNPDILPIFDKYKDLKMYCISDFYMGAESIKVLLDYLKLPVKIEKIYSSADYLLNKRTGNLYKKAEEEIGVKPGDHIHVGDNPYADIAMAQKLGIETIKTKKTDFNFLPEKNRKLCFNLNVAKREGSNRENKMFNAGVDLAPLIYFFGYSIIEYAIKNKIKKVYYQTREGETFIKIHQLINDNNPFGVDVPQFDILEVSRMATFSASLKEFSISELLRLWSQYRNQSMEALFKTLAIDVKQYKSFLGKYDLTAKENIIEPWFDIRVQNLCADEEFKAKIQKELDEKRNQLLQYFENKKNIKDDSEPLFVVDIGWRGTIQDNLSYIFKNKMIGGYYITLYDYFNLQPKNNYKIGYITDKNIRDNEVASIITLLEWIYNPGTGSVIEYKDGEAIRKAKDKETRIVKDYLKPMQEGMIEGGKVINEYMKYHPYEAEESKKYVYDLIKRIKKKPNKEIVEVYYKMVFNDTFGTAEYIEKDNKLSKIERLNVLKCRKMLRSESWKEAAIIYNNIGYMSALTKIKRGLRKMLGKG